MNNIYNKTMIGKRIAEQRKLKNMTQDKLKDALFISSRQTIGNWENGQTMPELEYIIDMCNIFDCDIDYLLGKIDCKHRVDTDIKMETGLTEHTITCIRHMPDFRDIINYIGDTCIKYYNAYNLFTCIRDYLNMTTEKESALKMYELQEYLNAFKVKMAEEEKLKKPLF